METGSSEEENWIVDNDGSMYQVSDSLRMLRESEFSPESDITPQSKNFKFPTNNFNTCTNFQPSESINSPPSSKSYPQLETPSQAANFSSGFPTVPSPTTNDCIAGNIETLKGRQCNSGQHFFAGPAIQSCQPIPFVPYNPQNLQHLPFCNRGPVITNLARKVPKMLNDRDNIQCSRTVNALPTHHVCKWQDINDSDGQLKTCALKFATIFEIVEHISEAHVTFETAEGDRHFCYWEGCDRKLHPFKARHKLINHIRSVNF